MPPRETYAVHAEVYTGGTFDCLHAGHVAFLARASHLGNLIVALNTDEFVQRYKGTTPVYSYAEREAHLRMLPFVYAVIPNTDGEDSRPTIERVQPSYLVIGSDWATRDYYRQMGFDQAWLDERGIALVYLPRVGTISTTEIKQRVRGDDS